MDDDFEFTSPPRPRTVTGHLLQWQPIETAPSSGRILLASEGGKRSFEGYWGGNNWYASFNEDMVTHPTHWAPMPPPPQS